jgi:hypothetical protein
MFEGYQKCTKGIGKLWVSIGYRKYSEGIEKILGGYRKRTKGIGNVRRVSKN